MDKKILEDYIDACEFIKETEAEIKKLEKKKRFVQDKVRGSNPDWPYEERLLAWADRLRRQQMPLRWQERRGSWRSRGR